MVVIYIYVYEICIYSVVIANRPDTTINEITHIHVEVISLYVMNYIFIVVGELFS